MAPTEGRVARPER